MDKPNQQRPDQGKTSQGPGQQQQQRRPQQPERDSERERREDD